MDTYDIIQKPRLTEPGVKYFLGQTLKQCKDFKDKYHYYIFNLGVFIGIFSVIAVFLIFRYKGKPTAEEIAQKDREKQQYILSKIQMLQITKQKERQELITGLPSWSNNFDNIR
jgi:hypothetical protein